MVIHLRCSAIYFQSFVFSMFASISKSFQVLSVLSLICLPGCSHQGVIQTAAGNQSINHGCPSWFIPINNSSDRCKCGKPIHRPRGGWCFVIQIQSRLWCKYPFVWTIMKKRMWSSLVIVLFSTRKQRFRECM